MIRLIGTDLSGRFAWGCVRVMWVGRAAATAACSELITLFAARALRGPENGYFAPKTAF